MIGPRIYYVGEEPNRNPFQVYAGVYDFAADTAVVLPLFLYMVEGDGPPSPWPAPTAMGELVRFGDRYCVTGDFEVMNCPS